MKVVGYPKKTQRQLNPFTFKEEKWPDDKEIQQLNLERRIATNSVIWNETFTLSMGTKSRNSMWSSCKVLNWISFSEISSWLLYWILWCNWCRVKQNELFHGSLPRFGWTCQNSTVWILEKMPSRRGWQSTRLRIFQRKIGRSWLEMTRSTRKWYWTK